MIESHSAIRVIRDRAPKVRMLDPATQHAIDDMLMIVRQELERRGITILSLGQVATTHPLANGSSTPCRPKAVEPAVVNEMLFRPSMEIARHSNLASVVPSQGVEAARKPRPAPWHAREYVLHYGALDGSMVKREPDLFEIETGTQVSATEVPALHLNHRKLRKALIERGDIRPDPDRVNGLVVVRPIAVKTGSKAAAIVTGSTKSPTRVWRAA